MLLLQKFLIIFDHKRRWLSFNKWQLTPVRFMSTSNNINHNFISQKKSTKKWKKKLKWNCISSRRHFEYQSALLGFRFLAFGLLGLLLLAGTVSASSYKSSFISSSPWKPYFLQQKKTKWPTLVPIHLQILCFSCIPVSWRSFVWAGRSDQSNKQGPVKLTCYVKTFLFLTFLLPIPRGPPWKLWL